MAEKGKQPEKAPAEASPAAAEPKKKPPMKTIMIVAVALVVEAVAISAVFMMSGKPTEVKADVHAKDAEKVADEPVEILVAQDRFFNNRSGRAYIYDTEIYMVVKKKNEARANEQMEKAQAQVLADISMIFRRAEMVHLLEPTLATLTRQVRAVLDERLGKDPEGKSLVDEVIFKKYTQFRAE